MTTEATPAKVRLTDGLGPLPECTVVAYLYHDAQTAEDAHPWLHSTMLVLAADRRPTLRNETPLVTLAQAVAMVAAERERWRAALRTEREGYDIMGLAEEQRQKPGPFGGPGTPNAVSGPNVADKRPVLRSA